MFVDYINSFYSSVQFTLETENMKSLNFADCRGQSYDNQATMSGIHSGVQTRLLDLNQQADVYKRQVSKTETTTY